MINAKPWLAICGLLLLLPGTVSAQIVINEIAAFELTDHEWVEIYNTGSSAVDLTGWKFWENATNHGLAVQQGDFSLPAQTFAIIAQKGDIFLADHPGFSGIVLDSSWGTLKESGEAVGLKDNAGNFVEQFTYLESPDASLERANAELADYTATNWWPHPSGSTPGQPNSNIGATKPATPPPATETSSASTPPPTAAAPPDPTPAVPRYSRLVVINEFCADPDGGQAEWVELYNAGDLPAKLDGWKLMEGAGAKKTLSGEVPAGGFLVVEPAGSLNNDGDHILILDDGNVVVNEISYGNWNDGQTADNAPTGENGQSVARRRDGAGSASSAADFAVTVKATPGAPNTIAAAMPTPLPTPTPSPTPLPLATPMPMPTPTSAPTPAVTSAGSESDTGSGMPAKTSPSPAPKEKTTPTPKPTPRGTVRGSQRVTSVTEVRAAAANAARTVVGTVLTLPGQIGKQIFYIADETGGLQIYQHLSNFPLLTLGDTVEVSGTVSQSQGETRLKAKDASAIRVLAAGSSPPAMERSVGELTATSSGRLVEISGEITESENRSFMFDDGSGEIEVTLPNGVETLPAAGSLGTAQGILVVRNGQTQLRLREPADLNLREPPTAPERALTAAPAQPLARYAVATAMSGGILGAIGWRTFRRRRKTTLPPLK